MTEPLNDPVVWVAADLLDRYGFERGAFSAEQLIGYWLRSYPPEWIRSAVLEALYQGRYKSVSVGQILAIWKRRGQPLYHYSFEFERMVCGTLARIPTVEEPTAEMHPMATPLPPKESQVFSEQGDGEVSPPPVEESLPAEGVAAVDLGIEELSRAIAPHSPSPSNPTPQLPELSPSEAAPDEDGVEAEGAIAPVPTHGTDFPASNEDFAFLATAPNWSQQDVIRPPIHQFIPDNAGSLFYEKLRAVAHEHLN